MRPGLSLVTHCSLTVGYVPSGVRHLAFSSCLCYLQSLGEEELHYEAFELAIVVLFVAIVTLIAVEVCPSLILARRQSGVGNLLQIHYGSIAETIAALNQMPFGHC